MELVITVISTASMIVQVLIIIWALMSFFPNVERSSLAPVKAALDQMVYPIVRPFQRLLPSLGGLDFSPFLALITINILAGLVIRFLMGFVHTSSF